MKEKKHRHPHKYTIEKQEKNMNRKSVFFLNDQSYQESKTYK